MVDWFTLALVALFFYSLQDFFYNIAARKKYDESTTILAFYIMSAALGLVAFLLTGSTVTDWVFVGSMAVIQSTFYLFHSVFKFKALKHISGMVAFPILAVNVAIIAVIGILFFNETLNLFQSIGILLSVSVFVLLLKKEGKTSKKNFINGVLFAFIAAIGLALTISFIKLVADQVNPFAFVFLSNSFALVPTYFIVKKFGKKRSTLKAPAIKLGSLAGACNFVAFAAAITALSTGPVSIISAITNIGFFGSLFLAELYFKDKITPRRVVALILVVVAIILLQVGI